MCLLKCCHFTWEESVKWYKKAGNLGSIRAQLHLARIYKKGIRKNEVEVRKKGKIKYGRSFGDHLIPIPGAGVIRFNAFESIGSIATNPWALRPSLNKMNYWLEKAEKNDNNYAKGQLIRKKSQNKSNVNNNGLKLLISEASEGDVNKQIKLGKRFASAPHQNIKESVYWYLQAANNGSYYSARKAEELVRKYPTQINDYSKLVKTHQNNYKDDALSAFFLGRLYEEGKGVAQNDGMALKYYQHAAWNGNCDAKNKIGEFYYKGKSIDQDFDEAYVWFKRAKYSNGPACIKRKVAIDNIALLYENGTIGNLKKK